MDARQTPVPLAARGDDIERHSEPECHHDIPTGSWGAMTCLSLLLITTGGLNNVLGKIRVKPLGSCSCVSVIVNTCAYCLVYWSFFVSEGTWLQKNLRAASHHRRWSEPLLHPEHHSRLANGDRDLWSDCKAVVARCGNWKYFILAGLADCLGNVLGIIAQPYVPGSLFALMNQATLPMAAFLSILFFRKRFTLCQGCAIGCVLLGGAVSLAPSLLATSSHPGSQLELQYSLITVLSTLPVALSSLLKEKVFRLYVPDQVPLMFPPSQESVDQRELLSSVRPSAADVFVFAALGSTFQLLFLPIVLPIVHIFGQFRGNSVWSFLTSGSSCLLGYSNATANLCHACIQTPQGCEAYGCCQWALATYIPYITVNITFNVLFLVLIVHGSTVIAFMTMNAILPVAVILFAFINWPLLTKEDAGVSPLVVVRMDCVRIIVVALVGQLGLLIVSGSIIWYHQAGSQSSRGRESF